MSSEGSQATRMVTLTLNHNMKLCHSHKENYIKKSSVINVLKMMAFTFVLECVYAAKYIIQLWKFMQTKSLPVIFWWWKNFCARIVCRPKIEVWLRLLRSGKSRVNFKISRMDCNKWLLQSEKTTNIFHIFGISTWNQISKRTSIWNYILSLKERHHNI